MPWNHSRWPSLILACIALCAPLAAADLKRPLETVLAVGSEGQGNREAAQAWKELAAQDASAIPEILAAFDHANGLAANYLRSAVETIAQRAINGKQRVSEQVLEAFIADLERSPKARRLAFEVLAQVDPGAAQRLVPGMLNDPSVELRREAVARLLEEASSAFDAADKPRAKALYAKALAAARDDDQVQSAKKRLEELGEKVDLPRHFGFLMNWHLVAPFDNTGLKGFDAIYPPERSVDLKDVYAGKNEAAIGWVRHSTDQEYGIVDLAKVLSPFKGAVAYAYTEFHSTADQVVDFRLGTPNSWKLWLNGKLLFARDEYHYGMSLDQYRMRGSLVKGRNRILLKVCQNEQKEEWAQRWQFQLRVCDQAGTAILSADRDAPAVALRFSR